MADSLAAMAWERKYGLVLLDNPPPNILHMLHDDSNGVCTKVVKTAR